MLSIINDAIDGKIILNFDHMLSNEFSQYYDIMLYNFFQDRID